MALPEVSGEFGIVKDPELTFLPSGKPKLKLRCAAKDRHKNDSGEWVDGQAVYLDVVVWQQAEALAESVIKGDSIVLTGRLKADEWKDKDGNTRTNTFIEATNVGPSVRWGVAKTIKAGATQGNINAVAEALGATVQSDTAPF